MKIEIIARNWVKDGSRDHLSDSAWKYSRPGENEINHDVKELNASINEIPSVVLAIESTIIEREVITSMRDHVIWARTSRIDDVTKFRVPDYIYEEHSEYYDMLKGDMKLHRDAGDSQDSYRLLLPLVANTKYMARISMRSLHRLYHEFERLESEANNRQAEKLFGDANKEIQKILEEMGLKHTMCKYKNILPNISYIHEAAEYNDYKNTATQINSSLSVKIKVPFSLRTHLVRHRQISIIDELRALCKHRILPLQLLDYSMIIEVTATKDDWISVISSRSCWMAHQKLWAPLVKIVSDSLGLKSYHPNGLLPCSDGICPYEIDAKNRLTDADPGSPCPRYLNLNDIAVPSKDLESIANTFESEDRSVLWIEEINKVVTK